MVPAEHGEQTRYTQQENTTVENFVPMALNVVKDLLGILSVPRMCTV
jgi:hypothetical protein